MMRNVVPMLGLLAAVGCRSIVVPEPETDTRRGPPPPVRASATAPRPEPADSPYLIRVVGKTLEIRYDARPTHPVVLNEIDLVHFDVVPRTPDLYNRFRYPELMFRRITLLRYPDGVERVEVWDHDPEQPWRFSVRLGEGVIHRNGQDRITLRVPMSLVQASPARPIMALRLMTPFWIALLENGRMVPIDLGATAATARP